MIRTGMGLDVHAFGAEVDPTDGHVLIKICGVEVPFTKPVIGHSDADVGLHALTDALLGAIAAGDIGDHFPSNDPKWKGADSTLFVEHAETLVQQAGGRIHNVDITIACELPKIAPFKMAMKKRVAEILDLKESQVNIKATTTEKLGFLGREEGLAAMAIATVDSI